MSPPELEVIRLETPPPSAPDLATWHTTRYASPRHKAIGDRAGAPWQARFDWILDTPLSRPPSRDDEIVLTQFRERPRTVFCKSGRLRLFLDRVLPTIEAPVTLYVGNSNLPLSLEAGDLQIFLGRYSMHRVTAVEGARTRFIAAPAWMRVPNYVNTVERSIDGYGRATELHYQRAASHDGLRE